MNFNAFINNLIDFASIKEIVDTLIQNLPFHFVLHPAVVHFALVLPVIALLFQLMALVSKNVSYRKAANLLFFLGVIAVLLATLSGRLAGPDVKPLLNAEGKALFDEHATIGFALAGFYILLAFLKTLSIFVKKRAFRIVMALLLIAGVGGLFVQAQHGGKLVYAYAGGVEIPDEDDMDEDDEVTPPSTQEETNTTH